MKKTSVIVNFVSHYSIQYSSTSRDKPKASTEREGGGEATFLSPCIYRGAQWFFVFIMLNGSYVCIMLLNGVLNVFIMVLNDVLDVFIMVLNDVLNVFIMVLHDVRKCIHYGAEWYILLHK